MTGPGRTIHRVAWAYEDGRLPGPWFQAYRRLVRGLERAGLDVRVALTPLRLVAPDADLVVVPAELERALAARLPRASIVAVEPRAAAARADELVRSLAEGRPSAPESPRPGSRRAVHRGFERVA